MKDISGWTRLGIFISLIWLVTLFILVIVERNSMQNGHHSEFGFFVLKDKLSGKVFPKDASLKDIERINELYNKKKSNSGNVDPKIEALLKMDIEPEINETVLIYLIVGPSLLITLFFYGIGWVIQGFKKRTNK